MTRLARVGLVVMALPLAASTDAQQRPAQPALEIHTLSAKADLVSGGDVLVRIAGPSSLTPKNVVVRLNGREITPALQPASQGGSLIGLITGLQAGSNALQVTLRGRRDAAEITLVNHSIAGPVIYSPHQAPFVCETQALGLGAALDADCTAPTKIEYFYRPVAAAAAGGPNAAGNLAAADSANGFGGGAGAANPFKPLDPNGPRPSDVAMTTTTDGRTVPYIVRREMGTINRAVYVIAFLHEPGTPLPSPASPATIWNGRLVYSFGGGCAAGYHQGRTVGGLNGGRSHLEDSQLGDYAIARGYALAGASLNVTGTNCDDVISAETMMMVKEHFIEQFGVPRYTIGSGRSGGSMQQHLIGNNYPGLLDGIVPTASFADTITFLYPLMDCDLLDRAITASRLPWTAEQKEAVSGEGSWDYCTNNKLRYNPVGAEMNCDTTTIPESMRFDPVMRPKGVRCTYQDNMVNVFGRDPKTGFARRPFDNVGVQYGLAAFNAGRITFEQFLDVNRRAGGHDANGAIVPERTAADPEALRLAYETGRINDAAHGLNAMPMIDMRPYTDRSPDVHDYAASYITRARLIAANGNADNQIFRVYERGASIVRAQSDNLDVMDRWLAAIARDTAPGTPREKMLRNKPAGLTDSCFTAKLEAITDAATCKAMFPIASNPRLAAGAPATADVLKCDIKPLDKNDYKRPIADAQLGALRAVFPQGVCDYSKKGVARAPAQTWQSFTATPAASTR
jgi:hypothetical protein